MDDNDQKSPYIIEVILQRAFSREELQTENDIKFGVIVALMFLDPTYDQVEILSSKVQERMNQWDSNPIVQKWVNLLVNLMLLSLIIILYIKLA